MGVAKRYEADGAGNLSRLAKQPRSNSLYWLDATQRSVVGVQGLSRRRRLHSCHVANAGVGSAHGFNKPLGGRVVGVMCQRHSFKGYSFIATNGLAPRCSGGRFRKRNLKHAKECSIQQRRGFACGVCRWKRRFGCSRNSAVSAARFESGFRERDGQGQHWRGPHSHGGFLKMIVCESGGHANGLTYFIFRFLRRPLVSTLCSQHDGTGSLLRLLPSSCELLNDLQMLVQGLSMSLS